MKTTFIYSLSDPNTGKVRYIGKANNIKYRLWSHIHEAKHNKKNQHKCNWIKLLLKEGKKPIINVIEEVSIDSWIEREKYWINKFRESGTDLLNITDGGECDIISDNCKRALAKAKRGQIKGFKHSEESKKLIREKRALQVITEEHKLKTSLTLKGIPKSEDWKRKISKGSKGKKFSKEHCLKISNFRKIKIKEIDVNGNEIIWDSVKQAALFHNTPACNISRYLKYPNSNSVALKSKFYYIN